MEDEEKVEVEDGENSLGKDIKLTKREKSILGKHIKKMRMKKKMGS